MPAANVFVSFSVTGDQPGRAFVRLLLTRLSDQPDLRVWIYESPLGQIASGESIAEECRRRIEGSDVFVLLLTDQALNSDYVAMEVSHAIWLREQRPLKIYPLLATQTPQEHWPPQLVAAVGFRGRKTDMACERVEEVVLDLCTALRIDYVSVPDDNRRLPLRSRLINELKAAQSTSEFETAEFKALLRKCDLAVKSMAEGDVTRARKVAESILLDTEMLYSGYRPYYVRVFHATSILAEAQRGLTTFDAAFLAFDQIVADADALMDANPYAGRGHVRLHLGQYDAALDDYCVAERLLDRLDPALLYSQFRARILSQSPIDAARIELLESMLQEGLVVQQVGDSTRIASVVGLAYAYAGDIGGVRRVWRYAIDPGEADAEVVCELCHWLEKRTAAVSVGPALRLCEQILEQRLSGAIDAESAEFAQLAHQLSRVEFRLGQHSAARARVAALLARFPKHVLLAVDAALFAVEDSDPTEAARLCLQAVSVVDHLQCSPPLDRVSFERAVGQAYWLLGRTAESRECYRRSALPASEWFDSTVPHLFGAATEPDRNSWLSSPVRPH
jgi:tetratricopeptide (TPR) repeat protein